MYIVRYGELGLKGRNRKFFEELLIKNIEKKIKKDGKEARIELARGRILIYGENLEDSLSKVPGIVSYSLADEMEYEEIFPYLQKELQNYNPKDFKVEAHRVDKSFPKKSPEINEEVGSFIVEKFKWKVNLKNPELIVGIEIINSKAFVFFSKNRGVGGLPVGSAGKLLLLISPGMDSSVAGFMMLRRGAEISALHFSQGEIGEKKVRKYVEKLSEFSPREIELKVIPHRDILGKYAEKLKNMRKERWTCVLCKYLMLKEAEKYAKKIGALGIITGDSLGQVASQTLNNMYSAQIGNEMPVYRPLIGMDKVDIEKIAREIGTYDIFISEKEEKCPFRPRYVSVQTNVERFKEILKDLGL